MIKNLIVVIYKKHFFGVCFFGRGRIPLKKETKSVCGAHRQYSAQKRSSCSGRRVYLHGIS